MKEYSVAYNKPHSTRMAIAAAIMLLIACGAIGTFLYLRHQAQTGQYDRVAQANQRVQNDWEKTREARLSMAKSLREKNRVWALRHQAELRKMLKNRSDRTAMMAVWQAIPKINANPNAGITGWDLRQGSSRSNPSGDRAGLTWTWAGIDKAVFSTRFNPPTANKWAGGSRQQHQQRVLSGLEKNYAEMDDVMLSSSMNPGTTHFYLWASGRITERSYVQNPNLGPGRPVLIKGKHKEIVPPYDFLQ